MKFGAHWTTTTLLLFLTDAFFLWMFFSAEGLELAALGGQVTGAPGVDPVHSALEFSARWRHGMTGGWPLYMPGFFLTAIAIWLWFDGSSILTVMVRAIAVMAVSAIAAWILAPFGSSLMIHEFTQETGFNAGAVPTSTIAGVLTGAYTLITWETFIAAGRCALAQKSLKPYLPAVVLTLGLGIVRPMLVDDFVSLWSRRVIEGNGTAIFSLILVPVLAIALLVIHTRQKQSHIS